MTTTVIFHLLLVAGVVLMALMAAVPVLVAAADEDDLAAPPIPAAEPRTVPVAGVRALGVGGGRPGAPSPAHAGVRVPRAA